MRYTSTVCSLIIGALLQPAVASKCPLAGPLLPRPSQLSKSQFFKDAAANLTKQLDSAVRGDIEAGFDTKNISFSIGLVSLESSDSIWEYHYAAPTNINGTKNPNGDSQYMIGSISKVFTDMILLKLNLGLDEPVVKYLPELKGDSLTAWEDITLGALADHLAGIGPTYGFPEIYDIVPVFEQLGFPHLPKTDFPSCGVEGLNSGCTKEELLSGLKEKAPVTLPNDRAIYSSVSFAVLSYAMQNATGKSYHQLLQDEILTPLGLKNTGDKPSDTTNAVIPNAQPNSWGIDYGDQAPGGGLRSSISDLLRLAHSILTRKALPSEAAVREWLQPTAVTPSLNNLIGLPWEIYRTTDLTPKHPHTIDIHAKDGGALAYVARFALLDTYGVGLAITSAGGKGNEALNPLGEAVLATFAPAIEEATREEAKQYLGTYTTDKYSVPQPLEDAKAPATMTLEMDDGPGILVKELTRNGTNILDSLAGIWNNQLVSPGNLTSELRLYPAGIERDSCLMVGGKNVTVVEEDWRLLLEPEPPAPVSALSKSGSGVWETQCASWQAIDAIYYGGQSVDRFVVVREKDGGKILAINSPALRVIMGKN